MSIRTKIFIGFLTALIPSVLIGGIVIANFQKINRLFADSIPGTTTEITKTSRLEELSLLIRYYDEVLTQSARNYAFTRDPMWKKRYDDAVPKLDGIIKETLLLSDQKDKDLFSSVDAANLALVAMEEESIRLVATGSAQDAIALLEEKNYWDQKTLYINAIDTFYRRKGTGFQEAISFSTLTHNTLMNEMGSAFRSALSMVAVAFIVSFLLVVVVGAVISSQIARSIGILYQSMQEVIRGNLQKKVPNLGSDEIGMLGSIFNQMTDRLRDSRDTMEQKVRERTQEFENLNSYFVGREIKMAQMKKENEQLKKDLEAKGAV